MKRMFKYEDEKDVQILLPMWEVIYDRYKSKTIKIARVMWRGTGAHCIKLTINDKFFDRIVTTIESLVLIGCDALLPW